MKVLPRACLQRRLGWLSDHIHHRRRPGAADRGVAVRQLSLIPCDCDLYRDLRGDTLAATDYTGKTFQENINHGDIRFTAIVSLR